MKKPAEAWEGRVASARKLLAFARSEVHESRWKNRRSVSSRLTGMIFAFVVLQEKFEPNEIGPSFVIPHRVKPEDAAAADRTFRDKKAGCIKVVLTT